jgi:hypothetical protein
MAEFICPFFNLVDNSGYDDTLKNWSSLTNCGLCQHFDWYSQNGDCAHREDLLNLGESEWLLKEKS